MSTSLSFNKKNIHIVLLEGIHSNAADRFRADGYPHITEVPKAVGGEELETLVQSAHFLGIRSRTQLTEAILQKAPRLNAIGCFCIGTNQVNLDAAQVNGVPVFNAPFANTRSVAELVLGEIILLLRGIPAKNAAAHRGEWLKSATGSF